MSGRTQEFRYADGDRTRPKCPGEGSDGLDDRGPLAADAVASGSPSPWALLPGLLLIGLGLGVMLTPSVNGVQSSFPEDRQSEISGLSRSVSNLASALGTAVVGIVIVADPAVGAYAADLIVLAGPRRICRGGETSSGGGPPMSRPVHGPATVRCRRVGPRG